MQMVKAWIDRNMEKLISKKMTAWVVSTVLLCTGELNQDNWLSITAVYLGTQGVIDALATLKGTKK